ncbi:MAG: hypothetical protein K2W81_08500 [Sphingomonas sp.]|uniref:hypothetical protein n=1 Tax=Sphingomonas sp. TaxID=28214 RepID=UPI0025E2CEE7|nr:hypothetical protein [Sphingomonas sp.]MBY0283989.1 hypothetical protein [Sphingomonas sp.]
MADVTDWINTRLFRHDRMVVVNELRAGLSAWTDRLIAVAVALIALVALHSWLSPRPLIVAGWAIAGLAAASGASGARLIEQRRIFHAYDGIIAADALADRAWRRYAAPIHALLCGIVAFVALIGRPATLGVAIISYLVGAGCGHIASRIMRRRSGATPSAPLRLDRSLLQRPIAGALAAIPVTLPLLFFSSAATEAMLVLTGVIAGAVALMLTLVDDGAIRFMALSGYKVGRIIGLHSRSLLVFSLLTVLACLILSASAAAIVIGCVAVAAFGVMTARILAYRVHAKRSADLIVGIGAVAAVLAGVALPLLLPLVVVAILWQLYRRAAPATWLLT